MNVSSINVPPLELKRSFDEALLSAAYSSFEDGEGHELAKFMYSNRVAERVRNLFFCAWNAWARFALVSAARRDAAIEVRFYVSRYIELWISKAEHQNIYTLLNTVLHAWVGVHLWAIRMRKLSITAARLLERCQLHEASTAKELMFALWLSRLQPLSSDGLHQKQSIGDWSNGRKTAHTPERPIPVKAEQIIPTQTSYNRTSLDRLFDAIESLVSVRSRRWRFVCDIRSLVDGSLLRVDELHGAMNALLRQVSLAPTVEVDRELEAQSLADVLDLSAGAVTYERQLQHRLGERKVLLASLLNCISDAIGLALECHGTGKDDLEKLEGVKVFSAELAKLLADEQQILQVCFAALDRVDGFAFDKESLDTTLGELLDRPGAMTRNSHEQRRAFDGAGQSVRQLLQGTAAGMSAMRDDSRRVLLYVNDSDLAKNFHAALLPLPSLIESAVEKRLVEDLHPGAPPDFLEEAVLLGVFPVGSGMKADKFLLKRKQTRLRPIWQAWVHVVQSVPTLRSAGANSHKSLPPNSNMYIREGPHVASPGPAMYGGPAGPATRATVRSVEQLLCGI